MYTLEHLTHLKFNFLLNEKVFSITCRRGCLPVVSASLNCVKSRKHDEDQRFDDCVNQCDNTDKTVLNNEQPIAYLNPVYVYLFSAIRATNPAHLILLDLITLIMYGEE